MRTETVVFYTLAMVLCGMAIILTACKKANYGALTSSVVVLMLVVSLTITSGCKDGDVQVVMQQPQQSPRAQAARLYTPQVYSPNAVAHVTNNAYVGPTFSPQVSKPLPPPLALPVKMEGQCPKLDMMNGTVPNCGSGYKIVPNMPPMPGMAQLTGEGMWRLPEYPVAQDSREGTIAAVVTDLPTCCNTTPKEVLRNQGLYGIKGNLSCDLLKRSAVSDHGFLEPLGARNAFLAYNSYDQLHAKDQYLIPVNKKQPE